ncbi:MAG TPA: hypothetical protein VGZ22_29505 [Isosphaeraceae bacterium]|nr:hypothetical protein [Isosphaeraceae bacterium]
MLEDGHEVVPDAGALDRGERRHRDLIEQVAEVGGLGQDLDIQELGGRLQGDSRQLVAPVQAAR